MDKYFWKEFYPEGTILPVLREMSYYVKTPLAGTGTNFAHWSHCKVMNRSVGIFDLPDAAVPLKKSCVSSVRHRRRSV